MGANGNNAIVFSMIFVIFMYIKSIGIIIINVYLVALAKVF